MIHLRTARIKEIIDLFKDKNKQPLKRLSVAVMPCQIVNAPLGVEPVTCPFRACANHRFGGGFDLTWIASQVSRNCKISDFS